jgi:choline-sulfatase
MGLRHGGPKQVTYYRWTGKKNGFKYIRYDAVGFEEQLLNLKEDPFETKHYTTDLKYREKLEKLKRSYENEWFQ